MKILPALLLCVFGLGLSGLAHATNWILVLKNTPAEQFEEEDLRLFLDAGRTALNETPDGQTVSWENPETKAAGSITIIKTRIRDELTCKQVKLHNSAKGRVGNQVLDLCKDTNGKWKFASPPKKK
jgi:surface antigen